MEQEAASRGRGRGSPGARHPTHHTDTRHVTQTHSTSHTRHVTETHDTSQRRTTRHTDTQHITHTTHHRDAQHVTQTHSRSHRHSTSHTRHVTEAHSTPHRHCAVALLHGVHREHERSPHLTRSLSPQAPRLRFPGRRPLPAHPARRPQQSTVHADPTPPGRQGHRQTSSAPRCLPRRGCDTRVSPSHRHAPLHASAVGAQPGCQQPRSLWAQVCAAVCGHAETAPRWQGPGVEPGSLQPCQGPAHLSGGLKISGAGTRPARLPAWSWVLRGVQGGCEVRSGCVGAARAPTGWACSQLDPALGARSADVPPQPQGGPVPHHHPGASLPGQSSEEAEG